MVSLSKRASCVQVKLLDAHGVFCLDARNRVSSGLVGDGTLVDDLGTSTAARVVQADKGRALLSARLNGGRSAASVTSPGLPTQFLHVQGE